ncbi:carbohydrate sulfotransferase 1-like isoform X2 [Ruditapes philippinarum]|nr:carbohydrate sulfotransferase 1-like isoform X2 [Ruditapes philippinarum]
MERHSDASRQSTNPAVTTTTKTFRSFGVVIVLVIFIFGYTALTMNHSRSVYYGGTIPPPVEVASRSGPKHRTVHADTKGSFAASRDNREGNGIKPQEPKDVNVTLRESFLDKITASIGDNVVSKAKIILIIAYMRTGSTLTGAIFQSFPGTFYVFEPIRLIGSFFNSMARNKMQRGTLKFANGTQRNVLLEDKQSIILDEINSWLNCKLTALNIHTLSNPHHAQHTNIMAAFTNCMKEEKKKQTPNLRRCFDEATSLCKKAPLRIIKFIRIKMKDAAMLLLLYPNLKIVHLVRDPRGIMNSRFKIHMASEDKIKSQVVGHCTTVYEDLKISKEIISEFPGRLKVILYEDLAERPLETAQSMFRFSGLPFNDYVQTFVERQTSAQRNSGKYTTLRKNSTVTANTWRKQIRFKVQNIVYNSCLESNKIIGYLPFSSEKMLRNLTVASRKKLDVNAELLKSKIKYSS